MNNHQHEQRLTSASQAAELLGRRRKTKGWSQAELASKLGLSQARLSALESHGAALTLERLIALANLLDLEVVLRDRPSKRQSADW